MKKVICFLFSTCFLLGCITASGPIRPQDGDVLATGTPVTNALPASRNSREYGKFIRDENSNVAVRVWMGAFGSVTNALPGHINDREFQKFTQDANTGTSVRVYVSGTEDERFEHTEQLNWVFSGLLSASTEIDETRVARKGGTIIGVWFSLNSRGNNGNTIVDLNKASLSAPFTTQQTNFTFTTVYTNQANRPTLAGLTGSGSDVAAIQATLPDTVDFSEGDFFSLDIDSKTANSRDLSVTLLVRYDL